MIVSAEIGPPRIRRVIGEASYNPELSAVEAEKRWRELGHEVIDHDTTLRIIKFLHLENLDPLDQVLSYFRDQGVI